MEERSFPTVHNALNGSSAQGGALRGKTSSEDIVFKTDEDVNEKFSLGDNESDTKMIADDLRQILNSGASAEELRRYIEGIDGRKQRNNIPRDTSPTERIVRTAHRQGLSVEEYLQQNWELYDVDGELNEDAVFAEDAGGYFAMSQSEQESIKEQLRQHQDELNNMEVVGSVNTRDYSQLDTGAARKKLVEELKETGYKVDRQGFGWIQFEESEINGSLNYKEKDPSAEDARRTGFLVLKNVLKRGIEIGGHDMHKGRNYDTVTIAAPVEINGKRGNMAVVVKRTSGNRYKVHRIMTPEGSAFTMPEMANAEMNTVGAVTNGSQSLGGSTPAINSASRNSIRRNDETVKEQFSIGDAAGEAETAGADQEQSEAMEQRQRGNGVRTETVQYSIGEQFDDAVSEMETIDDEKYLKDKSTAPFILVMEKTPKKILNAVKNMRDRRILIRRDAVYLAVRTNGVQDGHYHGLGAEVIKNIPQYLEDPDVVIQTNKNNRCLVLTHINAKAGQAIVSVEFDAIKDYEGEYEYFNIIVTAFDLKQRYLNSLFEKHGAEIKYENEDLAQVNPQLYEWLRIVNAKSSSTSLFNSDNSVKEQFSIGEADGDAETAGADQEQSEAAEPSRVDALPV